MSLTGIKIGIIGVGVIGSAILESFRNNNLDVIGYDKYREPYQTTFDELLKTDIIFLCLPTLYCNKLKEYNKSAIHENCQKLEESGYNKLIVLKSTVEPGTTDQLCSQYALEIIHNPEFLTARTAKDDFDHQSHIVIGKSVVRPNTDYSLLVNIYQNYYWCEKQKISICNSLESETMKIAVNSFYAVKVQFFNELYDICNKLPNLDYGTVRRLMLNNGWINPMHTEVPGHDGQLSYGGMCLPKDTNAFYQFLKKNNSLQGVIKATIDEHDSLRDID